jgi:hypothetical protein
MLPKLSVCFSTRYLHRGGVTQGFKSEISKQAAFLYGTKPPCVSDVTPRPCTFQDVAAADPIVRLRLASSAAERGDRLGRPPDRSRDSFSFAIRSSWPGPVRLYLQSALSFAVEQNREPSIERPRTGRRCCTARAGRRCCTTRAGRRCCTVHTGRRVLSSSCRTPCTDLVTPGADAVHIPGCHSSRSDCTLAFGLVRCVTPGADTGLVTPIVTHCLDTDVMLAPARVPTKHPERLRVTLYNFMPPPGMLPVLPKEVTLSFLSVDKEKE